MEPSSLTNFKERQLFKIEDDTLHISDYLSTASSAVHMGPK